MKTFAVVVAVALLLVAAAALLAPAALLDVRLAAATQGRLRMASTTGTLWRGHGILTGEPRTWSLPVHWTIDRWSLLRGVVAVTLRGPDEDDLPRGTLEWHDGALTLNGMAFTLPAAVLDGALAAGNAVALGGQWDVDVPHFSWNDGASEGAASVRWMGARIAGNAGTLALGTVTANFQPRADGVAGHIENRGGDVRIDGELTLRPAGSTANVTLWPLSSTPSAITRVLGALGTPDATGAVRVQWRSTTP